MAFAGLQSLMGTPENSVLSGMQQMNQTALAPAMSLAQLLNSQAMYNYYMGRGLNYDALAGLNQQKTDAGLGVAQASKDVSQTNLNNAKTQYVAPLAQAAINQKSAEAANQGIKAANLGAPVTVGPTGINGGQASAAQAMTSSPRFAMQMQDPDLFNSASKGESLPPLSNQFVPITNPNPMLMKQLDSAQQFADKLNNSYTAVSDPNVQKYIGPSISAAGLARGKQDTMGRLGQSQDPAYLTYNQGVVQNILGGEGLANIAAPTSRAASIIHANMKLIDPTQVSSPQQLSSQLLTVAQNHIQDLNAIVRGNYPNPVRQRAWGQLQYMSNLPVYQKAMGTTQNSQDAALQNSTQTLNAQANALTKQLQPTLNSLQQGKAPQPGENPAFDAWLARQQGGK